MPSKNAVGAPEGQWPEFPRYAKPNGSCPLKANAKWEVKDVVTLLAPEIEGRQVERIIKKHGGRVWIAFHLAEEFEGDCGSSNYHACAARQSWIQLSPVHLAQGRTRPRGAGGVGS
jgi:hypothetical protein